MPHTPGPWKRIHEQADPHWSAVVGPRGKIIANVCDVSGIPPEVKMPRDANAALIAAAPDMLEALHTRLDYTLHTEEDSIDDLRSRLDTIAKITRAAIAKAEERA